MAKHCTNCGHELRDTDRFCAECGMAVGGATATEQAARQGHWVYETFTESLGEAKFKNLSWPYDGGVPIAKSGNVAGHIEKVVNQLVSRVALEGWEPTESVTASSLWREQHVKSKNGSTLLSTDWVQLESVSVGFRRWVSS